MIKWVDKWARFASKQLALLCTIALGLMALFVATDIGCRIFLNQSLMGSLETVKLLMVVVIFTSFANTQLTKGHIKAEVLIEHLPPRVKAVLEYCILLLCFAFTTLWLWQCATAAYVSWQTKEFTFGFIKYYTWPAKMLMTLGMAVLCFQLLADVLSGFKELTESEADGGVETQ
jgi:TRAP-type C4-dicarboxylate transport system permease small subunit